MQSFEATYVLLLLTAPAALGLQTSNAVLMNAKGSLQRRDADDGKVAAVDAEIQGLTYDQKAKLWWTVTQEINHKGGFPCSGCGGPTSERNSVDRWTGKLAADMETKKLSGQVCCETGDGHFLKQFFATICKSSLSVDKFDPAAAVKLDLNLPPATAPEDVKQSFGTADLLVSHQVFEHLLHPTVGIANLNAMLKVQGQLIFSTPFIVQDHKSAPNEQQHQDYFRYTVRSIHLLLQCAGFDVRTLHGIGNRLTNIAYVAGIGAKNIPTADLDDFCDGLTTDDCENKYYGAVGAVAVKTKDVTVAEIRDCFA